MASQIRKILIANRGEIALRILRTCRELRIAPIAVYSDADRFSPHVLAADEAHRIGPPASRDSYLRIETLIDVARRAGADAIHPGYGFLSENAEFARRVREAGLIFIGPRPESIAAMGDKTAARALVAAAGVPTVPGTDGAVTEVGEAEEFCSLHGFPVLLKAAAGGGGKGMRVVNRSSDLGPMFQAACSEARSAFGDGRVYVEKYLTEPRHIEFQILADRQGNTVHLGERECSIQRRHQKVIEETPSVFLDDDLRRRMGETAVNAARACGYENAGTIEFLVDGKRNFYFLEMNTRLQVEHPVTELRTGLDLVALQILIASGGELPFRQEEVTFRGHAIECRICAEDVENNYLPATGRIMHLRTPAGPGIREDRGVQEGGEISRYYDSMIAKLAVWGADRPMAIARMKRALREYELLGVVTNIPLCAFVMDHPEFAAGNFTTNFLAQNFDSRTSRAADPVSDGAVAVVCAMLADEDREVSPPSNGATIPNGGRWRSLREEGMRTR